MDIPWPSGKASQARESLQKVGIIGLQLWPVQHVGVEFKSLPGSVVCTQRYNAVAMDVCKGGVWVGYQFCTVQQTDSCVSMKLACLCEIGH